MVESTKRSGSTIGRGKPEVEKAQEKGKALLMMGGVEVSMVGDEWRSRSRQEVDLVFYPCSSGVGR
jgi:hypothetical protein